jgi:YaiO family outer membrane protein
MKNKNYLALRAFFCHTHSTYTLNSTYRRYFSEKEDYVYAALGYGNYSDDFLQLNPDLGKSYMAQIGAHKFITARWFFLASIGYARDENKAYTNGYRNRFQASAGVRYYFNMFK